MAQEAIRQCGYRKVGGLYIIGEKPGSPCDRLPYPINNCPVCGEGIKFSRGYQHLNFVKYAGSHTMDFLGKPLVCADGLGCPVCNPNLFKQPFGLLWVGQEYTPASFLDEARRLGVSKRLAAKPRGIKIGDIILLAHNEAAAGLNFINPWEIVDEEEAEAEIIDGHINEGEDSDIPTEVKHDEPKNHPGIFMTFTVTRFDKLIWQKDATDEELAALRQQGINPVIIPDGDLDHDPKVKNDFTADQIMDKRIDELKKLFPRRT